MGVCRCQRVWELVPASLASGRKRLVERPRHHLFVIILAFAADLRLRVHDGEMAAHLLKVSLTRPVPQFARTFVPLLIFNDDREFYIISSFDFSTISGN